MNVKKQMSISEFSRMTGIKSDNLRFYDKIGILCPEYRGENGYRYYSRRQLNTAYLIGTLRGLGMGLETIRQYSLKRTPEKMLTLFSQQDAAIQEEIFRLEEVRGIMSLYSDMVRKALCYSKDAVFLEHKSAESIFICPPIPESMDIDEGIIFSYDYATSNNINVGYPLGGMLTRENLYNKNFYSIYRNYFKNTNNANHIKPEGLYAVAYGHCTMWDTADTYERLLNFINKENKVIQSDVYEEYPFDDIAVQESHPHCVRIEVLVS